MTRAQVPGRQQITRELADLRRRFGRDRSSDAAEFVLLFIARHAQLGTLDATDAAMIVAWHRLYKAAEAT